MDGGMSGWREGGWRDGTCVILMTLTFVHKKMGQLLIPLMKPLLIAVKNSYI